MWRGGKGGKREWVNGEMKGAGVREEREKRMRGGREKGLPGFVVFCYFFVFLFCFGFNELIRNK